MNEITLKLKINADFVSALEHLAQVIESLPAQCAVAPVQTPEPTPTPAPAPQPEPTPVQPVQQALAQQPTYTIDDLARKAQVIMDAGKLQPLTDLLAKYSVSMLPQLPQEQYAAFYKDMEGLA